MAAPLAQLGKTRQQLLRHLLRAPRGATVEELGGVAGVTHNAVRQHLTALIANGHVERGALRATGGRPEQLFVLTAAGREIFPRRYPQLTAELVKAIGDEFGAAHVGVLLRRLGARMGAELAATIPADAGMPARVRAIAAAMTELGYEAQAQLADPRVPPQIVAHNCVFHQVAAELPEVCGFDLALLEQASGRPVQHAECMLRGGAACRFRFLKR